MNEIIKGLHLKVAKILESEDLSLWQKFNSFEPRLKSAKKTGFN